MRGMRNTLIPVVDSDTLKRDAHSKGIVNTDIKAAEEAKARKFALNKRKERDTQTQERLATLETSVNEMKTLLQSILEKL